MSEQVDIVAEGRKLSRSIKKEWDDCEYSYAIDSLCDHVERLEAQRAAILKLHAPFKIYDDCGHKHTNHDLDSGLAIEVEECGLVCEDGYQYSVCYHCCTDDTGDMTEWCMDHDHGKDKPICATVALTTGTPVQIDAVSEVITKVWQDSAEEAGKFLIYGHRASEADQKQQADYANAVWEAQHDQ